MKRTHLLLVVFLLSSLATTATAAPAWIDLGGKGTPETDGKMLVRAGAGAEVALDVQFDGIWLETIDTTAGPFVQVELTGGAGAGAVGAPRYPVLRRRIAVPYGGDVKVLWHRDEPVSLSLDHPLSPAQPAQRKCDLPSEFAYDAEAYAAEKGDAAVRIVDEQIWRGVRHVVVEIRPVEWDAVSGELTLYRHVQVAVRTRNPELARTEDILRRTLPGMKREVSAQVSGLDLLLDTKGGVPATPIHYVMVVADHANQGFADVLGPLVDWKREKGFTVSVLLTSQIGRSKEDIKSALRSMYQNPDPSVGAPAYLLLVGDVQHIPFWEGTGDGEDQAADMYYATMDAPDSNYTGDLVPDFHVGRFSVGTASELATVVRKTLAHEKPVDPSAAWYRRSLWIASEDHDALGRETHQWVAPAFEEEGMVVRNAFNDTMGESVALREAKAGMEEGQSIINYSGHGYHEGWACVDVPAAYVTALEDTGAYPFVITNACQVGQFQYNEQGDCFSETWLKAPGGAVASWAASNNSLWDEDDLIEKAVWAAMLPSLRARTDDPNMAGYPWPSDDAYTTIGAVTDLGLLLFHDRADSSWSIQYAIEEYNILGDPSVDLWTRNPMAVTLDAPSAVILGQSELVLGVSADGAPVKNALVAVSREGELRRAQWTDESGEVVVSLDGLTSPGDLHVVVTGHNLAPHVTDLVVIPPGGAYVGLQAKSWDDTDAGETVGNGNGQPSPGERLALAVEMKNFGDDPAHDVVVTLASDDTCVDVTRATVSLGDMASGAVAAPAQPFLVDVLPCANDHRVEFLLTATSPDGSWEQALRFTVGNAVDGAVVAEATGLALPGTVVSWTGPETGQVEVGADATFVIQGLDEGTYTFTAQHAEYLAEEKRVAIPLSGALDFQLGRARIRVNPVSFDVSVAAAQPTRDLDLELQNTGDRGLVYDVMSSYERGDDDYGYRWTASDDGEIDYEWREIPAADRTRISLDDDDDVTISLPFAFPFYGADQHTVKVGSNGYMNFGASDTSPPYSDSSLPSGDAPMGLLAVYYDDLDPSSGGEVYWGVVNGDLIVTWDGVPEYSWWGDAARFTFQCVLSPTGEIVFNYRSVGNEGWLGLQDMSASSGMRPQPALHDEMAVAIATSVSWLEVTGDEGDVNPDTSKIVGIGVRAAHLAVGDYTTTVRIKSNDLLEPVVAVPFTLHVVNVLDSDGDGHQDGDDNCPLTPNPDQIDANGNGVGDACEVDCAALDCDDANPCTEDSCDPIAGCVYAPYGGRCDDGDPCTTGDRCVDGECVPDEAMDCDDGDPCTDDSCAATGCRHTPNQAPCDDGNLCTTGDVCSDGVCVGVPESCDDGNPCTDDLCSPDSGCRSIPNAAVCDDGDGCTENVCQGGECVVVGENPGCCQSDADCDVPREVCAAGTCSAVQCAACDADEDCGAAGNRCGAFGSGDYCMVMCASDDDCPADSVCEDGEDGALYCVPEAGDCVCEAEFRQACAGDALVWFDSCDEAGAVVEDCGERGCVDGACCADGTHAAEGVCVPDVVCEPEDHVVCHDGDVYWFDSCDERGELVESCDGRGCVDGACVPDIVCEPMDYQACRDGAVTWFDSCDVAGEVVESCGERGCVDGACCPEGTHLRNDGVCVPDQACAPRDHQGCHDGNVVWFDSCGDPGPGVEACNGRGCVDGACCPEGTENVDGACVEPPACTPRDSVQCVDGDAYWFDSCDVMGELAADCDGRGCAAGACCPTGMHVEDGVCVSDDTPVEPGDDVVGGDDAGDDAGGDPPITLDATGGADAGDGPSVVGGGGCSGGPQGPAAPWAGVIVLGLLLGGALLRRRVRA